MTGNSKLVDRKTTKQVRIDAGWHQILKVDSARAQTTIRELIETCLGDYYQETKKALGISGLNHP